jgi:hypothetical protein
MIRLYTGRLSPETHEDDLKGLLAQFGNTVTEEIIRRIQTSG